MPNDDIEQIRAQLPMLQLLRRDDVEMARSGPNFIGLCPFHHEKTPSFTVHHHGEDDHAHCYGCGWHGDIFDYWKQRTGQDFAAVKMELAAMAGIAPHRGAATGVFLKRRNASSETQPKQKEKPVLPWMRFLKRSEMYELAALRGISLAGVSLAAAHRRLGFCKWPQFHRHGEWVMAPDAAPSWVVTDDSRTVAQFRRLDGGMFTTREGKEIKAWTKGSPTWPIGAEDVRERQCVLMVEGGADMLAAYHFLALLQRDAQVAVLAMLGGSMRICDEALALFAPRPLAAKRVRILMDEDEPKDERGIRPGCEAAARWTEQLTMAGAAVETFSFVDLAQPDGTKVKDLNDLAKCDAKVWQDREVRAAFFNFDF